MIKHNALLKCIIDLPIFLMFYLQMETLDNAFEFEYKNLLMQKNQQFDIKNYIKSSSC